MAGLVGVVVPVVLHLLGDKGRIVQQCENESLCIAGDGNEVVVSADAESPEPLPPRAREILQRAERLYLTGDYEVLVQFEEGIAESDEYADMPRAARRRLSEWAGKAAFELGNLASAEEAYNRALEQTRQDDRRRRAALNINLGAVAAERGDQEKARFLLRQAREGIGEEDRRGLALLANNECAVRDPARPMEEAQDRCLEAVRIFTETRDERGQVMALINLGVLAYEGRGFPNAMMRFREALAIAQRIGFARGESIALNDLALVESAQGRVRDAATHLEAAIRAARKGVNKLLEGRAMNNLAILFLQCGDARYAETLLEKAKVLLSQTGAPRDQKIIAGNLRLAIDAPDQEPPVGLQCPRPEDVKVL